ncbi:hypothetical protein ACP4OV_024968 [Aristida adscensionis]
MYSFHATGTGTLESDEEERDCCQTPSSPSASAPTRSPQAPVGMPCTYGGLSCCEQLISVGDSGMRRIPDGASGDCRFCCYYVLFSLFIGFTVNPIVTDLASQLPYLEPGAGRGGRSAREMVLCIHSSPLLQHSRTPGVLVGLSTERAIREKAACRKSSGD